jgi:hypothetical protein
LAADFLQAAQFHSEHAMASDLQQRYEALRREMVEQFERTSAAENLWLAFVLLGWEFLAACAVSHYFVEVLDLQKPYRWPYVVLWIGQILLAIATVKIVSRGGRAVNESPLEPPTKRLWLMFILLSMNIAVLNVIAGEPVFAFLPALAALCSLAFTALTCLVSPRFMSAGLFMFAVGILMANFPQYGFLIYGVGWWIILQVLGVIFLRKRRRWLTEANAQATPLSVPLERRNQEATLRP